MKRTLTILLNLFLATAPLHATNSSTTVVPMENGTLVYAPDQRAPMVAFTLYIPLGKLDGKTPAAWELVHHDRDGKVLLRSEAMGASLHATMSDSWSSLHLEVTAQQWRDAAVLMNDILRLHQWDTDRIKANHREHMVRYRYDRKRAEFVGAQALTKRLFGKGDKRNRAYQAPHLPGKKQIQQQLRSMCLHKDRFLAISGALSQEQAVEAARISLASPTQETMPEQETRAVEAFSGGDTLQEVIKGINQTSFFYGRQSLSYTDSQHAALLVADYALGGHFHARLPTLLRHTHGLTYHARTSGRSDLIVMPYYLYTYTQTASAPTVEKHLRQLLENLARNGITEQERTEALAWMRGSAPYRRVTPVQRSGRVALEHMFGLEPNHFDTLIARAEKLSLDEINRFISEFYDPTHFTMIRVTNDK